MFHGNKKKLIGLIFIGLVFATRDAHSAEPSKIPSTVSKEEELKKAEELKNGQKKSGQKIQQKASNSSSNSQSAKLNSNSKLKAQAPSKSASNSKLKNTSAQKSKLPSPSLPPASPLDMPMGKPTMNSATSANGAKPVGPAPLVASPPSKGASVTAAEASKNQKARSEVKRPPSGPGMFADFDKRASLFYGTWREPLTYSYGTTNSGGKASFAGFFARYELSKPSKPLNWGGALSLFYGGADAKSNDSLTYRVNKVGIQALIFSPFAYWEAMPEVRLKIALDIVYKVISWPSTAGSYDVKTKPFGYGPNIGLEYQIWKQLALEQKIGSYSTAGDVFWLIGATYKLK